MNGYDFLFSTEAASIIKLGLIIYGVAIAIVVIIIAIIEESKHNEK